MQDKTKSFTEMGIKNSTDMSIVMGLQKASLFGLESHQFWPQFSYHLYHLLSPGHLLCQVLQVFLGVHLTNVNLRTSSYFKVYFLENNSRAKRRKKRMLSDKGNPSLFIKYLGYLRKEEIAKD